MKNQIRYPLVALALLALFIFNSQTSTAFAQGTTAFTYQGQLRDNGTNANGTYTMVFELYDSASGGNQVSGTISNSVVLVNGLFTVNLDYGAGSFNGAARWLDITVQSGSDSEELSPRVQVLPSPYALYAGIAATVTNGAITSAQLAANAVAAANIQSGAITNKNLSANAINGTNIASGQVVKNINGFTDGVNVYPGENVTLFVNPTTGLNITNGFAIAASPIPHIQLFYGGGKFVVPPGVTRIMVEMWGAGGGGGMGFYQAAQYDDMGNLISPEISNPGGGGGAGGYALNVFTVVSGSSYSISDQSGPTAPDTDGVTSSIDGPGIFMEAGGGQSGGDADTSGSGIGGAGGTETGDITGGQLGAGSGQDGDQGGQGGQVWRGGNAFSGPACGGVGGSPGATGGEGSFGLVLIYY